MTYSLHQIEAWDQYNALLFASGWSLNADDALLYNIILNVSSSLYLLQNISKLEAKRTNVF